jgi:hypothetical protein
MTNNCGSHVFNIGGFCIKRGCLRALEKGSLFGCHGGEAAFVRKA